MACKSNKEVSIPSKGNNTQSLITFLDSIPASEAIALSDSEGFFDQLSEIEIKIQMKSNMEFSNRDEAVTSYKSFIRTQVSNWKEGEKQTLSELFEKVKKMCDTLSPKLYPSGINLIKVKTSHYGNDVYYTRGNNIMIPENIFPMVEPEYQLPVMVHEVFHILSRYNPSLRHELYALIGFAKTEKPVKLNEYIQKMLLTNPDGVSYQYAIELENNGKMTKAIPLITSKLSNFKSDQPMFFDYLKFDIYSLEDKGDHYLVKSTTTGETLMPLSSTPSFFTKIKDNTQYIIHPDEIMADNFMLGLLAYSNDDYKKFSKEGRILINQVLEKLKAL